MPKVTGRVYKLINRDGQNYAVLALGRTIPKLRDYVTIKWGSCRSTSQNAFYWVFLNWCINEGGLEDQGHFSPEALHLDLKAHFLSSKIFSKGQFKSIEEGSTAILDKTQFSEYLTAVDQFMVSFFNIDTSPFWDQHGKAMK